MNRESLNWKVLLYTLPAMIIASCVNPDYDLSKGITTDATFFEKVTLPVGNVEKITIEELMFSESEAAGLSCEANGDYHIEFTSGDFSTEISVPDLYLEGITFEDQSIKVNIPASFNQASELIGDATLKFSDVNGGKPFEFDMDIEFDTELPYQIVDIEEVTLDAMMECRFTLSAGKATFMKGFTLAFPEYIFLSPSENVTVYEIIDEHVLCFTEDVAITAGNEISIPFRFNKVTVPDDMIVYEENGPDRLSTMDYIHVTGDFFINSSDFTTIPESIEIILNMVVSDLSVTDARVKLDYNIEIPDEEVVMDELPELLKGGDFTIDLYNPLLHVKAANNSPFDFSIDAYVTAYSGNEVNDVYIGHNGNPLLVNGNMTKDYYFSRREMEVPSGADNVVIPQIGELIKNIPDRILIHDINVSSLTELITVKAGANYNAAIQYAMRAPLSFDNELYLSFTQDIENLNLEFDLDIPSAGLSMVMVNSIPVDFDIKAICLDAAGKEITGTTVRLDNIIAAGTQHNPTETPLTLTIENNNEKFVVSSLRLTMTASSSENTEYHGVCLNKEQGFEIKDITVTLPDGIGYEFDLNIM